MLSYMSLPNLKHSHINSPACIQFSAKEILYIIAMGIQKFSLS